MTRDEVFALRGRYVAPTYAPELLLVRGDGARVWDIDGREYLDFAAGISVCNLGHCHPRVTAAIAAQAGRLVHVSNLYLNEWQPLLASKLVANSFDGVVFFANSGAEANEGMIKLARKWGNARGRNKIVYMDGSFHGRTLAALAATGQTKYRQGFEPETPGFVGVPFNDIAAAKAAAVDAAAILVEPVQGEGGVVPASQEYLRELREFCDERGVLLLFDEVQCGMGRTGKLFAHQHYGVAPDAMSLAKALGNGVPIGALVIARKYADTLQVGDHASTFGGNPLACAAANAVLDALLEDDILDNCRRQGEMLERELRALAEADGGVREIRGLGLMLGMAMERPERAKEVVGAAARRGLLLLTAGKDVVRLLPPLIIDEAQVRQAVALIKESLTETRS